MKICAYCDSVNDDSAKVCTACGASKFKNKCNNCGNVFETAFCPVCGTKAGAQAKVCPQCGERYFTPACPKCGHNGILNRTQQPVEEAPQRVVVEYVTRTEDKPKKKVTFGKVLLWIFFLPIMAIIAIWRSKLAVKWKIVLTAVVVVLMLLYTYGNKATKTAENQSSAATSKTVSSVTTANPVATAKPKTTAVPATEQKPARNGFDEATNQVYQIEKIRFSIPAYFISQEKGDTQNQMSFSASESGKEVVLTVFCEKMVAMTKEEFERKGKDEFQAGVLKPMENVQVIDEIDGLFLGFPSRTFSFSGYYSGFDLDMRVCFAYDDSSSKLVAFMIGQTKDSKYDYLSDYEKILNSAILVENQTQEPKRDASGVSSDLKAILDDYEAFVDAYCAFMEKYNSSSDVTGLALEYLDILSKYTSWMRKIDDIDTNALSGADLLYYDEVILRCSGKMLKAVGN